MNPGSLSKPDAEELVAVPIGTSELAVEAANLRKTFRIPHETRASVRDYVLHPFRRTTYETQTALDDVSFEITSGEFFGVIGRNGSGKSTLLRVLAGIYEADEGSVRVNGKLSPFIELGVGFNAELSARDNVVINGTLLGLSGPEIAQRFDDIIAFGELERFVDQKLKNFSSGMQLRLAYSIAIQVPFNILLLDEVLAVGDQNFQDKCFATFEGMRNEGKTVVLVTHDLRAVARFCDRALLLRDGVVQGIGAPAEVTEVYLEQEKRRGTGTKARRRDSAPRRAEPALGRNGRADLGDEAGRRLEAHWRSLTASDLERMSAGEIHEIVRMQQALLDERRQELRELERDVDQLQQIVDAVVRWHHGQFPIPPKPLRFGKRTTKLNFFAHGVVAADRVFEIFGQTPPGPMLEWGCGSGRVARWLVSRPGWCESYNGCDTDREAVAWLVANLGVQAVVCNPEPPVPYTEGAFAGVFAFTMLTQLDPKRHRDWYRELARVLQPGGSALLVTQGPALAAAKKRDGRSIGREVEERGWAFLEAHPVSAAFVSEAFTRSVVEGLLDVVEYRPQGYGSVDLYLFRRPE
jgi:ABC-type polysaccharide/polyol phosphate transport system ATPase subunit/SAM-dependent methyltransferase